MFRRINTCIKKVLELAAYNQLIEYLQTNNIFLDNQSGFRSDFSCESAIQVTISQWKIYIDDGLYVVAVCKVISHSLIS